MNMFEARKRVEHFTKDFANAASHISDDVEIAFVGSALGSRWRIGRSDVDIVIYFKGKVGTGVERSLFKLYWQLDLKHHTRLMSAPFLHPPIIFARNRVERALVASILEADDPKRELLKEFLVKFALPTGLFMPFLEASGRYLNLLFLLLLFVVCRLLIRGIGTKKSHRIIGKSTCLHLMRS